jgi:hypothetical protein
MNNPTILVFINDSLGELDWIQPFILWGAQNGYTFHVYFNLPGKDESERLNIFEDYFKNSSNIYLLNKKLRLPRLLSMADRYTNSILRRISGLNYRFFKILRFFVDVLRGVVGLLLGLMYKPPKVDCIFRDYNLKDSFALSILRSRNRNAKIIIFPHSTAIQSNSKNTPKNTPKKIKVDLFLENTILSTQFSSPFKETFVAVGSPSFDSLENSKPIASYKKKSFLFITRNCDERYFGINYQDSGEVFEKALSWAKVNGYTVYVKHHPRDLRLEFWRNIQKKFDNVVEVTKTLNHFSEKIAFALCLYTSAGLLFTIRGVPVFDVSPYKGNVEKLPFHSFDKNGNIVHELIDYGFYGQVNNLEKFFSTISIEYLEKSANSQLSVLKKYFPAHSCQKIDEAVKSIL